MESLEQKIQLVFADVWQSQNEASAPVLASSDILLESGLDSLGFAIFVSRLEEELGYDPFTLADDAYYPQTFGEFVAFYKKYQPI